MSKVFILIYWIVCQIVGMPLLVGLIHFEKNQGDPMKRHLIDMVRNQLYHVVKTKHLYCLYTATGLPLLVAHNC